MHACMYVLNSFVKVLETLKWYESENIFRNAIIVSNQQTNF